jgi:hypothetical protein
VIQELTVPDECMKKGTPVELRASECEKVFSGVNSSAAQLGMKINDGKTQLLCVMPDNKQGVAASIKINEKTIQSGQSLKILGFVFGKKLNASEHVKYIQSRVADQMWILRKLKKAGWHTKDTVKIYCTVIRPIIEYCSNVYHSLLYTNEINLLESIQRRCLRIILGYNKTHDELLREAGVETLLERRMVKIDKFVLRVEQNKRFADKWLTHSTVTRDLRKKDKYETARTKTKRAEKNPVSFYTRRLNWLYRT